MATEASTESVRKTALKLLQQGLASPSEVAELSGHSRQLVRFWIKSSGVDWRTARTSALAKAWRKAAKS